MKKILFVLAIILCCGIFTSCSTYACFQVKLNGGTTKTLTPKYQESESVITDKWYYVDSTNTTYVVLQLEDSATMTYNIVSPMFKANIGEKIVYNKQNGFEMSPITNVIVKSVYNYGDYYELILIGDVYDGYGENPKNKEVSISIKPQYVLWFKNKIYLSLYDLDLLRPYISYKIVD